MVIVHALPRSADSSTTSAAATASPYRVSVVIPTKNRRSLLVEAINSVRSIEGPDLDLEILVCDNGSTDDTLQVATALGARVLHATTPGPAAARNVGIRAATGDYIAFLDDDDLWLPEQLRPQLALLSSRPELDACLGQILPTDADGNPLGPPYPAALPSDGDVFGEFLQRWPQIGGLVVRASVRESVGYQDERLLSSQDWDWELRVALRHRVGHVAVPGLMFRSRPIATDREDETNWKRVWVHRRVFWRNVWRGRQRPLPWMKVLRSAVRFDGVYTGYFLRSGAAHASAGELTASCRSLTRALAISPLHVAASLLRQPAAIKWMGRALLHW